jgi:hypothetical protein
MKKILSIIIFALFFTEPINAQPYVDGGNTRHRFAQLNLGTSYRFLSNENTKSYDIINDDFLPQQLKNQHELGLIIGGTHFWGHADFYVLFPLSSLGKADFSSGVETGMKIYPWRIENNKIRTFIGSSINSIRFQQGDGVTLARTTYPIHTGFTFNRGQYLIDMGFSYVIKNEFDYYLNTTYSKIINTHNLWFNFGFKLMLETTLGAEKSWKDGKTERITTSLAEKGRLNNFSIAIGPSSTNFTAKSTFNDEIYPFLDNHKFANIFPEFGFGYYWHKPDIQINISYRNIKDELKAYGYQQKSYRKAITLEGYKFMSDYHGFAFFMGPAISHEALKSELTFGNSVLSKGLFNGIKPGITIGWDIRPNRIQALLLRTNLRYFPNLKVNMDNGKTISLDNLEFNFIQLVVYPGRFTGKPL